MARVVLVFEVRKKSSWLLFRKLLERAMPSEIQLILEDWGVVKPPTPTTDNKKIPRP